MLIEAYQGTSTFLHQSKIMHASEGLRVLIRKQAHSEPAPDRVLTAYQHYAIIQPTLKED